jgi:ligand-binding SRPBCC domain-containing protein
MNLDRYPTSFVDRMLSGPMAHWKHEHCFREVAAGVELTDILTYAHQPGWQGILSRLVFDGPALRALFRYRHWRTHHALRHLSRG